MKDIKVKKHFEKWADNFDQLYSFDNQSIGWACFNKVFRKAMYERVNLTYSAIDRLKCLTILDVGCGSARQLIYGVKHGILHATGIDFSNEMLELAGKYAEKAGVKENISLIKGDFLLEEFKEIYDAVYALGVFDYIDKPVEMLEKMRNIASKIVIATFPSPSLIRMPLRKLRYSLRDCPLFFYSEERLNKIADSAGFLRYQIERFSSSGLIFYGYTND